LNKRPLSRQYSESLEAKLRNPHPSKSELYRPTVAPAHLLLQSTRIFEIGGMIFGDEEWKPDPIWAGLGGNFGDEQSIRIEGGWSY
jgi:hypothetical protein